MPFDSGCHSLTGICTFRPITYKQKSNGLDTAIKVRSTATVRDNGSSLTAVLFYFFHFLAENIKAVTDGKDRTFSCSLDINLVRFSATQAKIPASQYFLSLHHPGYLQ